MEECCIWCWYLEASFTEGTSWLEEHVHQPELLLWPKCFKFPLKASCQSCFGGLVMKEDSLKSTERKH